jgi:hypothetical protein
MTTSTQTQSFFRFGDTQPDYALPVLNERAVRASAGILFFFGLVCFMNGWLVGNFQPTRVFVVTFLVLHDSHLHQPQLRAEPDCWEMVREETVA